AVSFSPFHESCARTLGRNVLISMSHSSRAHAVSDHQSPFLLHGPANARICRRIPSQVRNVGLPSRKSSVAGSGGRYMCNTAVVCFSPPARFSLIYGETMRFGGNETGPFLSSRN